jgi:multidrug efflux pump subunit AcrB
MKLSEFFISRPIFAGVLSALIFLAGLIALPLLPISEYPEVVPPTVVVKATYPGANPKVIAETVASPLEQAINGVEGMLYQSSQATADGLMTLTITFALSTDIDKAQVQVQNRVAQALPKLPDVVQRLGVTTNKASPDLTMVVHLVSPDNRYDTLVSVELRAATGQRRARTPRWSRRCAGLRRRAVLDAHLARSREGREPGISLPMMS